MANEHHLEASGNGEDDHDTGPERSDLPAVGSSPQSEVVRRSYDRVWIHDHTTSQESKLSPVEQRALQLSALGMPDTRVGVALGRSSKWVQRLRRRPEGIEYLRDAHASLLNEISAEVGQGMIEAVIAAREDLRSSNASARSRAITFFGDRFDRFTASRMGGEHEELRNELRDAQARLQALEDAEDD